MIRVLEIISDLGSGGAESLVMSMMESGFGSDFDVRLCSLSGEIPNLRINRLRQKGINPVFLGMKSKFDPRIIFAIRRLFREFRPNVVHTHLKSIAYVLPVLLVEKGPLHVHTVHNIASMEGARGYTRIATLLAVKLNKTTLVGLSRIISESIKSYYKVEDAPIVHNGIVVSDFAVHEDRRKEIRRSLGVPDDAIMCCNVGRLFPQKNQLFLINAFARSYNKNRNLMLCIAGDGPLRKSIERHARDLDVAERVKLLGRRSDIPEILNASDIFIFPSLWEGIPISVLEAMAARLPVVATAVGGIPDLINNGENGILVPPDNEAALADAISGFASDKEYADRIASNGLRFVRESYDISRTVNGYENLFKELLMRESHPNGFGSVV